MRQKISRERNTPVRTNHVHRKAAAAPDSPLLGLQHSIGNHAVQRLIHSPYIQTKLQISEPGDEHEQEADRVADTVMRMPEPESSKPPAVSPVTQPEEDEEKVVATKSKGRVPLAVREDDDKEEKVARKTEEDKSEDEEHVDLKADGAPGNIPGTTANHIASMNGRGSPLPDSTRAFFEPRLGADLSQVRVHTDSQAAESASSINARAFTVGPNIAFGSGQYAPESERGRQLLAHELTHVMQQSHKVSPMIQRWGELEHKTAGNEPQNEFPYRGTISVDMTALRKTPRKPANDQYGNISLDLFSGAKVLVVGKERAWLQVVVEKGTARDKKGATVVADTATGYVSKELITKSPDTFDADLPIAGGLNLSYGDLTAMGGDHFKDLSQLMGEASTGLGRAKLRKLRDTIDNLKTKSVDFDDPNVISQDYADRFKDLALVNVPHFSQGGTSGSTWFMMHSEATAKAFEAGGKGQTDGLMRAYVINGFADHFLTDSFSAGHVRVPRQQIIEYYKNLINQIFGQIIDNLSTRLGNRIYHYLEEDYTRVDWFGDEGDRRDTVNAVRNKINNVFLPTLGGAAKVQELFALYVAGAISKVLHDTDNKNGLNVVSKKHPEGWTALGDGKLDVPANANNRAFMMEAVKASKQDLVDAYRIGLGLWSRFGATPPQDAVSTATFEVWMKVGPPYKAWDFVPTPAPSAPPLGGWEWGKLDQATRTKIETLIQGYLKDYRKTLEDFVNKLPETEEVRGYDTRPRQAARDILNELFANPLQFIEGILGRRASP
ncbi:MAG TPA: DUF4157 domain-containing protein [Pyrinomonadaceae bacterium]|nr:DUF4157 domain-containing protein [Pyrinomonadaceae bacterium]